MIRAYWPTWPPRSIGGAVGIIPCAPCQTRAGSRRQAGPPRDLSASRGSATAGINSATISYGWWRWKLRDFDDLTDDDAVIAHRARAKAELGQIARQAKQALADAGIDLSLFFLVPNSGDATLTFGTITDPPDDEWEQVGEIVSAIVRQTVGLIGPDAVR